MKLSSLNRLRERVWFKPFPDKDPLEVCLVPAEAAVLGPLGGNVLDPEIVTIRVCSRAFVDFKGVVDEAGAEVPNSLETRKLIYADTAVRARIDNRLHELNFEAVQGEAEGASDSRDMPSPR